MTATSATINLDKLRNTVQKFARHSFTTSQVATEYQHGDVQINAADTQRFEDLLHRHAALLGINAQPSSAAGDTVWQAV